MQGAAIAAVLCAQQQQEQQQQRQQQQQQQQQGEEQQQMGQHSEHQAGQPLPVITPGLNLRFAILASGFPSPAPQHTQLLQQAGVLTTPSLHIYSSKVAPDLDRTHTTAPVPTATSPTATAPTTLAPDSAPPPFPRLRPHVVAACACG